MMSRSSRTRDVGRPAATAVGSGLVILLAALVVSGAVLVWGTAATAASPYCAEVLPGASGTWTRRPAPAFPAGRQELRSHAIDPSSPLRQYATNGVAVMATEDGCTWSEALRLPGTPSSQMPASSATDRVLEVVVHPRSPDRVWLVVAVGQDVAERVRLGVPLSPGAEEKRDGTRTLVLTSRDAGRTWSPMTGAPLEGAPGRLAPAPSHPAVLYLPTASGLHSSRDGGATWTPRPPVVTTPAPQQKPLDAVTSPLLTHLAVDPSDPATLYGRTSTAVRSHDGGLTWTSEGIPPGHVTGPFVDGGVDPARRVLVGFQAFSTSPVTSLWLRRPPSDALEEVPLEAGRVEGVPWRAVWSPVGDEMLMATWDRGSADSFPDVSLYRVDSTGTVEDVDDLDLPQVWGLVGDDYGGYHLHTTHELVTLHRSSPAAESPAGPPQVAMDPFSAPDPPRPGPAVLTGPAAVELAPEQPGGLNLSLRLPRRPTPLDTYFLVDTSNSFEPDIQALADGLGDVVRALAADGVDAWFGLGELGTRDARRYRRFADIAAPGADLQRGFERLRTGGSVESHLIALNQAATGSGVTGTSGPAVAPGQAPTWREDSLRTLLVVTDVEYSDEDDPEAPARHEVYGALADRGVRVIALEVVREGGDDGVPGGYAAVEAADAASTTAPTPARRDLEELAAATGSFAPPGGVDCRDNGTVEIPAGDPMVCTTTELHLARTSTLAGVLLRVLQAQVDRRPVRLRFRGDVEVAATTPGRWTHPAVDVKSRDQVLTFDGTLRCGEDQAGRRLPLVAEALVGGTPVASSTVQVDCGPVAPGGASPPQTSGATAPAAQPQPAAPVTGPASGPEAAALVPGVPPPVVAPISGTAPAPWSAPAPGSASAPGAAPGTAPATAPGAVGSPAAVGRVQDEEAPAVAHASLQMTVAGRPSPPMHPWTLIGAAMLTVAATAGRLHRARHQPRPRPMRNSSR